MRNEASTTAAPWVKKMKLAGNFIANQWSTPKKGVEFQKENPAAPSEIIARGQWSLEAVGEAVEAAQKAAPAWDRLGTEARVEYLLKFRSALEARQEEISAAISQEMGKVGWEARTEAKALLAKIDLMTGEGLNFTATVHPEGLTGGYWRRRPLGVVGVLAPFNFPLHLANGHIIPALATGNTVVVKPSEEAPLSMQLYFQCLQEADLPPGVVNMVQGPGEVGAQLVADRRVRGILFTGSYHTGVRIREATVRSPGRLLALEMGGKNTTLVMSDADLEQAATEILLSSCLTTGQRCSATSRVVVERAVAQELKERLKSLFEGITTGAPQEDVFMGPLASAKGYQSFLKAQGNDEGGKLRSLLEGGAFEDRKGYFVRPSLWEALEFDPSGPHQSEELFGPDVVIYDVDNQKEAIQVANGTEYGLAMSVFTTHRERFLDMSYELETGILNWNRSTVGASSRLPFGGVKQSGNHRPAAILAGEYCTFPQATLEVEPGFDEKAFQSGPLSYLKLASRD